MQYIKRYFSLLLVSILFFTSCGLDENPAYDLKFFHIMVNESSSVTVSAKANTVGTYNIYFSTPATNETVTLTYEVVAGDGLKEGVDFRVLNDENSITFLPGIYDMPVRIQWMAHSLDPTKDNSVKIRLISNDRGYSIGFPGPAQHQSELTITKV